MRIQLSIVIVGLALFFNRGLMSEHSHHPLSSPWVTIQEEEIGLRVDFPHHPLEMNIDLPFQNNPPAGHLRLLSAPTAKGLLAFGHFASPTLEGKSLQKEQLREFFEMVWAPHFFFNPAVFHQQQHYHFQPIHIDRQEAGSFQFSFKDHKVLKRLEGIAMLHDQILYVAFYMASDIDFDQEVYQHFLQSIQFPTVH